MKKSHKGIRNYSADEVSNLAIGQNGFDILSGTAEVEAGVTSNYEDVKFWIAIKAINGDDAVVTARTMAGIPGSSLGTAGAYNTGQKITIENGDIIYGVFDKVACSASDYIICYRG